ncbi:VCBS repeat-containing protein [Algoriphagus boritolerans]|uniref:Repeat domain-containing protein n=1 Tax=Algoriphagus boritolerans DSM 17298 = JCM 18970 TaxID=1120964 RepID=A0A1H5YZT2_9BACT|nr:VCBS repeat-containing protein [Algoriphagus boritolerans]SEG28686.1 Repeat domain-containing protein [Algoriphagus boritolerans DSM 17298 = JCM 18970]
MKRFRLPCLLITSFWFLFSCDKAEQKNIPEVTIASDPIFRLLSSDSTGISFSNLIEENLNLNVLMYEYLYNGGGVAVGDLNQDGLDDIYFSANVGQNQLYLNEGNLKFKDITQASGATGRPGPWKTGVVLVDINGDGKLDIYLCHSGTLQPEKRKNELFVNQGNDSNEIPQFKEMAEDYGIASEATSTSAAFFDYDLDGDLDLFLLNHNTKSIQNFDPTVTKKLLLEKHEAGSQLFENQNGKFVEVTEKAGISSSSLSYGLGVSVADINGDGWPDIYIGNDYSMPDYLYINQKNGKFKDEIQSRLDHVSHFSMGNDIADINNDGLLDIFTLDMLPEDNLRQKLLLSPDNFEMFQLNLDRGFYYQYMRNMLHINSGDGTFREIGQLSGISNTDWSWSALFSDFDLDGWKDLHITNGYLRDYNNQDFLKYMDNYVRTAGGQLKREDLLNLVKSMSSSNLKNYTFKNNGDLTFENVSASWGLTQNANSNGAAYADLDNDGDLDLIINNINAPAFVYENLAIQKEKGNFLKIELKGEGQNTIGQGALVKVFTNGSMQVQEQNIYRGFQSSVSPILVFGLGQNTKADSVQVIWPGGKLSQLSAPQTNQKHVISQAEASKIKPKSVINSMPLLTQAGKITVPKSSEVNDFKRQPLLSFGISGNGKALVVEDFDGDGNPDIFLGGGAGISGRLFFGKGNGQFDRPDSAAFVSAALSEDTDALSFDANGDDFPDLLIGSGGMHQFFDGEPGLQDRLYLNDGNGKFTISADALPNEAFSTGSLTQGDFNTDGITDIFVGGRVVPGQYPIAPGGRIWIGDGKGKFTDQTASLAPDFKNLGMITDSGWADLDGDGQDELILVGDAMPITIFSKSTDTWKNTTSAYFESPQVGFWSELLIEDWDGDGKPELFVGNHGENSQLFASDTQPMELLYKDFDANGSIDAILSYYIQGEKYPSPSRDEVLGQVLFLKKRYLDFKSFSEVKMDELFTPEERKDSRSIFINRLETSYFVLGQNGKFQPKSIPLESQFSPVFAAASADLDGDGNLDLILGGNLFDTKLKFGRYDANHGTILLGKGNGEFVAQTPLDSGLSLKGEIRKIEVLGDYLLFYIKDQGIYLIKHHLSK